MPMTKRFSLILPLTLLFVLFGYKGTKGMNIQGQIIYSGGGNSVKALSLGEKESKPIVIYQDQKTGNISHLTKMSDSVLYFDKCSGKSHCIIFQLNLSNNEVLPLRTGFFPEYVPGHEQLFFYDKAADGTNWLFVASLNNLNMVSRVAKAATTVTLPNGIQQIGIRPVVQISKFEVLYLNEEGELAIYNITNANSSSLGIVGCRPIFWRAFTKQLFCTNLQAGEPFLLDLQSKKREKIYELNGAHGFLYIEKLDSVVYSKTRALFPFFPLGEANDIFHYSLRNKGESRIKKNSSIAAGVWISGTKP